MRSANHLSWPPVAKVGNHIYVMPSWMMVLLAILTFKTPRHVRPNRRLLKNPFGLNLFITVFYNGWHLCGKVLLPSWMFADSVCNCQTPVGIKSHERDRGNDTVTVSIPCESGWFASVTDKMTTSNNDVSFFMVTSELIFIPALYQVGFDESLAVTAMVGTENANKAQRNRKEIDM